MLKTPRINIGNAGCFCENTPCPFLSKIDKEKRVRGIKFKCDKYGKSMETCRRDDHQPMRLNSCINESRGY